MSELPPLSPEVVEAALVIVMRELAQPNAQESWENTIRRAIRAADEARGMRVEHTWMDAQMGAKPSTTGPPTHYRLCSRWFSVGEE